MNLLWSIFHMWTVFFHPEHTPTPNTHTPSDPHHSLQRRTGTLFHLMRIWSLCRTVYHPHFVSAILRWMYSTSNAFETNLRSFQLSIKTWAACRCAVRFRTDWAAGRRCTARRFASRVPPREYSAVCRRRAVRWTRSIQFSLIHMYS